MNHEILLRIDKLFFSFTNNFYRCSIYCISRNPSEIFHHLSNRFYQSSGNLQMINIIKIFQLFSNCPSSNCHQISFIHLLFFCHKLDFKIPFCCDKFKIYTLLPASFTSKVTFFDGNLKLRNNVLHVNILGEELPTIFLIILLVKRPVLLEIPESLFELNMLLPGKKCGEKTPPIIGEEPRFDILHRQFFRSFNVFKVNERVMQDTHYITPVIAPFKPTRYNCRSVAIEEDFRKGEMIDGILQDSSRLGSSKVGESGEKFNRIINFSHIYKIVFKKTFKVFRQAV